MQEPPHATVAAIVEQNGRFLLVRERAEGREVYNQPAGHLDPGESLLEAVVRETQEETAWTVQPTALVGLYVYHAPANGVSYLRVCFAADALHHDPGQALDPEILAAEWKTVQEIRDLETRGLARSPMVLRCVEDYLHGQRLSLDTVHAMN